MTIELRDYAKKLSYGVKTFYNIYHVFIRRNRQRKSRIFSYFCSRTSNCKHSL